MVRPLTIALLLLAAATSPDAAAQSRLRLSPVGDEVKPVAAGAIATVLFRAENLGTDTLAVATSIELPEGWTVAARPAPLRLAPGLSGNLLVAFKTGRKALPDTSLVGLHALATDGDTLSSAHSPVRVLASPKLQASVLAAPQAAPTQDSHTVRFAVTNDGNVRQGIDLHVSSSLGFEVEFTPSRLQLAPFTSAEVVAVITPDPRIDGRHRHLLALTAIGDAEGGESPSARTQAETLVMPRGRSLAARGRTIPVRLGVSTQSVDGYSSRQFDLSVAEWNVAGGTAEITVRGPRPTRSGLFASQDFYQASYSRAGYDVRIGDQYVRQTELVTQGAPGFGLRLAGPIGRLEAAAYALRSRYGFPRRDRQGLSLGLPLGAGFRVGLEATAERYLAASRAASLTADWAPSPTTGVHVEAAAGSYDGETGTGLSTRARFSGDGRRIDLRYHRATSGFPGTFRGTTQVTGSSSITLVRRLSLDAMFQSTRRAYDFSSAAPTTQEYGRIGLANAIRLPLGFSLQHGAAASGRTHLSPAQGIDRRELGVSAFASLHHARIGARFAHERGLTEGVISAQSFEHSDLTFYFRYGRLAVNLSASQDDGPRVFFPVDSRRRQLGAGMTLRVGQGLTADLQYYFNESTSPYAFRMHLGEAELAYRLPFGHELAVRSRVVVNEGGYRSTRDVAGGIAYRVPLDVPASGRAAGVHGKVLFADSGRPARDVIVRLGEQTVLTDAQGRFWFGRAGEGRIDVDASLVDPWLVVLNPEALEFGQPTGSTIEIYLTPGSSLSGSFVLDERSSPDVLADDVSQDDLAIRGMTVVASNGAVERLAMTGVDGSFRLTGLSPGTWTLSARASTIPAGFRATEEPIEVTVGPGARAEVAIPVFRRSRAVRMVGSASLSLAAPSDRVEPAGADAIPSDLQVVASSDPGRTDGPRRTGSARPESPSTPEVRDMADLAPAATLPSYPPDADLAPGRDRRLAGLALLLALAAALAFLRLGLRARKVRVRRVRHAVIHRPSRMRLVAGGRRALRSTGTHGSADPP